MQTRKLLFGMGIALWMVACSRTPLPTSRDAAQEVQPAPDVNANTDLVPTDPDSATLAPDMAAPDVLARDAAAPDLSDAAVPDLLARDAAGADAAVPDTLVRDAAAPDLSDAAVPDLLARDAAGADGAVPDLLVRDAVVDVVDVVARDAMMADVATAEAASDVRDSAGQDVVDFADTRDATHSLGGRTFRIDDMNPAPTPDPTCTPSGPASAAELTLSSDLTALTGVASSGSTAFTFSATAGPESNRRTYHVTNLSGGQVFFEGDHGVYVAQVILYGSGVPVMWCLRGALLPQP